MFRSVAIIALLFGSAAQAAPRDPEDKPQMTKTFTENFNKDGNVDRLANYALKDGVPFDMISRTTPTGGVETTFLGQLLKGGSDPNAAIRNALGAQQ